jgi:hypothetical protein
MRRLIVAGLLPERAGQPVKAWVHISLADLMLLDADSALQDQWITHVRERWAARRAFASETGSEGGAWLDGDAAAAIACDAAMAPIVTGEVNVDALEDLVRLCVEPDARRRDGARDAAWAAIEQAVIGKAVDLVSGPGGLASFLRRRSWVPGWPGRAFLWTSGSARTSRRGSATRCCCGTGTASGPEGAASQRRPVRCTIRSTRSTAARPQSRTASFFVPSTTRS